MAIPLAALALCALVPRAGAAEGTPVPSLHQTAAERHLQGRVLWMDGLANRRTLSTREGVRRIVTKCKKAHINTIVLDVKPIPGYVLYNSSIAPKMTEWKGETYPKGYDLLKTMLEEAHAVGISVHAALNAFSEGHLVSKQGVAYRKTDWQSVVYDADRYAVANGGRIFPLALKANRPPQSDGLAVWTTRTKAVRLGELNAVVVGGKVTELIEGSASGPPVLVPPEGATVLSGVGAGRDWLRRNVTLGASLKIEARPCFKRFAESAVPSWGVFINPIHPKARAYELSLVREILKRYPVDGIAFDRMRYEGLTTDFSTISRRGFEGWLGRSVEHWPQDIFTYDPIPGAPLVPGKLYREWLEWRAVNIRDFLADVDAIRRKERSSAKLSVYVGSWYEYYYQKSFNWAAGKHGLQYDWMSPTYPATSCAGYLDFLMAGAFFQKCSRMEAQRSGASPQQSVEGSVQFSAELVNGETRVYGGLYLLLYKGRPDVFENAVRTVLEVGEGVMLFDLVYLEKYNWWPILERLFREPALAPHDAPVPARSSQAQ